jgi:transposase
MEVLDQRCAGLDVHKETVVACVRIAAAGGVEREVRSFATTTSGLLALADWLGEHGCTHVAMEATGVYWKPVWHVLEEGFELVLANPAHVKNVPGRKTDVNDATWLGEVVAHGLIRSSFVPERATQELRWLMRTRKQLVREQVSHVAAEGPGGRQHQARLGTVRHSRGERAGDAGGADRRRERSRRARRIGASPRIGRR